MANFSLQDWVLVFTPPRPHLNPHPDPHLFNLVGPLDDDSFDVVLQGHVTLLSVRLPHDDFLLFDPRRTLLK